MEASMTHYVWQFGLITIIIITLLASNYAEQQHAQIVVPAIEGDSVLLRTTRGQVVLIDTGNDAPKLLEFIGSYRRQVQHGTVDTVIITQSGDAWHGALPALIMRGVTHIIWLPASHTTGMQLCATQPVTCTFATTSDRWHVDGLTLQVAGTHSLWVVWSSGQLLIAHSGLESFDLPTTTGLTGLIYPWRIEPPLDRYRHAQVAFVLYSDGMHPKKSARRSMAQRRISHERLLHEEIDGDIYLTLSNPPHLERVVRP